MLWHRKLRASDPNAQLNEVWVRNAIVKQDAALCSDKPAPLFGAGSNVCTVRAASAFIEAYDELNAQFGSIVSLGELQQFHFKHPLLDETLLGCLYRRDAPGAGSPFTVSPMSAAGMLVVVVMVVVVVVVLLLLLVIVVVFTHVIFKKYILFRHAWSVAAHDCRSRQRR